MVRDVLGWYRNHPDDWKKTWELIDRKYQQNPDYRRFSCSGPRSDFNIDAKINGAYILVGLLYGQGDLDQTIIISTRCGQDSDCNPSNAAGVLFTTLGRSKLPERFVSGIDAQGKSSHTEYTFPRLIEVCGQLVRTAVERSGGRIERDAEGNEILVIPVQEAQPSALQQSWDPGPIAGSRFTEEEMAQIIRPAAALQPGLDLVFPGWTLQHCGSDMQPGRRAEYRGRKNVFMTHPLNREVGAVLSRTIHLPSGKKSTLRTVVANDDRGDWVLMVKAEGQLLLEKPINQQTTGGGWATVEVDLSGLAGKQVKLELVNQPDGWSWEAGYWAEIAVESR